MPVFRFANKLAAVIALFLGLLVLGCETDSPIRYGQGQDGVPNIIQDDTSLDTFWIARIGLDELDQRSGSDPGHTTLLSAYFSDFTYYRIVLADRLPFSDACSIYTSLPSEVKFCQWETSCSQSSQCPEGNTCIEGSCVPLTTACQEDGECPGILVCTQGMCASPMCTEGTCPNQYQCLRGPRFPLYVNQVTFGGLVGGDQVLTSTNPGRIQSVLSGRVFEQDTLSVTVSSDNGERDFPSFEQGEIRAPALPVLTRLGDWSDPDLSSALSLGISMDRVESFILEWEAKDADYFEFKIIPGAGSNTPYMKLRCITFDDGGLEVPAEALRYLAQDQATNFQLKVERHNFELHSIQEAEETKAAALVDVSSTLEGTVIR